VKTRALRLLERLRLLRPAYRAYETTRSFGRDKSQTAGDLPLPPRRLMMRVAGTPDVDWFLSSGQVSADTVREATARHGRPLDEIRSLLDFGCGCGRVTRWWRDLDAEVHGSDADGGAVEWCQANLRFGHFAANDLAPPLRYGAATFDLVYAFSVLTHLTEELQKPWMEDLHRVLRPGGLLVLSTHGERYLERLSPTERARFVAGDLVVRWGAVAGTNLCTTFHPRAYFERLADGFDLLEHIPEGAAGNPHQDLWVLRKV
jgi:2-polyprenyl-3-methyl-5-hydroxy-6-metoxy-1,4-benzoquinol methylase